MSAVLSLKRLELSNLRLGHSERHVLALAVRVHHEDLARARWKPQPDRQARLFGRELGEGACPKQLGHAVSACFRARRSRVAAEAGLETAGAFRGRGLGSRVTAAWALAIRESGRTPLYSTSWDNDASRAVAGKLGLRTYASSWSIHG